MNVVAVEELDSDNSTTSPRVIYEIGSQLYFLSDTENKPFFSTPSTLNTYVGGINTTSNTIDIMITYVNTKYGGIVSQVSFNLTTLD
mmetsp:Transcript_33393/g.30383  ORF Transcript_33393/g.30383 Transcript_33393/m.30383 type:complete len:87 (-) Transcript_33393:303-563(-)